MLAQSEIARLLCGHARTMALSLQILPRDLREPLELAYLLARISDTVADEGDASAVERIVWLERFASCLESKSLAQDPPSATGFSSQEMELLAALPGILALLEKSPDREEIKALLREILEGQLFDLRRFSHGGPPLDRAELERYCDLVAGSVGRCWTRLIAGHAPGKLLLPAERLLPLAGDYGKGLQLVNILRDRWEDRVAGRNYLKEEEVPELLKLAAMWLRSGSSCCEGLRPGRILVATSLPLNLAQATLPLVEGSLKAKLSRSTVRGILLRSLASLWLPRRADPAS
jgi:farnesyl-diphosphate farnesyltransferase